MSYTFDSGTHPQETAVPRDFNRPMSVRGHQRQMQAARRLISAFAPIASELWHRSINSVANGAKADIERQLLLTTRLQLARDTRNFFGGARRAGCPRSQRTGPNGSAKRRANQSPTLVLKSLHVELI